MATERNTETQKNTAGPAGYGHPADPAANVRHRTAAILADHIIGRESPTKRVRLVPAGTTTGPTTVTRRLAVTGLIGVARLIAIVGLAAETRLENQIGRRNVTAYFNLRRAMLEPTKFISVDTMFYDSVRLHPRIG